MLGDRKSEKRIVDFKENFHVPSHKQNSIVTEKVKNSGTRDNENEKILGAIAEVVAHTVKGYIVSALTVADRLGISGKRATLCLFAVSTICLILRCRAEPSRLYTSRSNLAPYNEVQCGFRCSEWYGVQRRDACSSG
jgi:hypothetical protein